MNEKQRRRRTCADRLRRDLAERQRQRRGGDPGGKVLLQLLTLLSGALAMMPPIPMPAFTFSFRPARQPFSSIDEDLGPTAYAMERGLEPLNTSTRMRPPPSVRRLVKDLSRPRKADQARELLELRVPHAVIEWLRDSINTGDLWRLRMAARPGASDDEVIASMLTAAQMWEIERQQQAAAPEAEPPEDTADDKKGPNP